MIDEELGGCPHGFILATCTKCKAALGLQTIAALQGGVSGQPITQLDYIVESHGEPAAGINGFSEAVSINFEYGIPPENMTDLVAHFRESLRNWYDGAKVYTAKEYNDLIDQLEQAMGPEKA